MGYLERHEQPGYFRDITRHFDAQATLLDVGCGSAWLAEHFVHYTGVDASLQAVETAKARGRNVLHLDAGVALPFEDGTFSAAVVKDVLEHVEDPVALVREIHRVLEPGGRVFASSPDAQKWAWDDYTHRRPFTRRGYKLLFEDAGFSVEKDGYESVMPGTGVVSGWTRGKRRPMPFRALARLPMVRRNVWLLARKPARGRSDQPASASS